MKRIFLLFIVVANLLSAYSQEKHEQRVANLLYGFNRLLQWPEYINNTLQVNIYKSAEISEYINYLSKLNRPAINIVATTVDYPTFCNIFFVPEKYFDEFLQKYDLLTGKPILIVTDKLNALSSQKVDVELYYIDRTDTEKYLSYKANITSIQAKNIKVSPEFVGYAFTH